MNMSTFRLLSASALARPLRSKNWTALHVNQVVCAATAQKGSLNHQYVESKDYNCKTKSRAWWVPAQRERDLRDIQKGKGCGDEELAFDHHRIHSSDQFPFPTKTLQQKCVQLRSLRAAASTERFGAIERERNPAHSCHDASRQYSSVKREVSNEGRDTEKQGRKASEGLGGPAPTTPITENAGVGSGGSMNAGWSYEEACTVPNLVSLARALSAPWLGLCIINDQWEIAIAGTLVAGFSDWLDGYLAKRMKNQSSSLGSYLDPLADKVMITCLTLASGYKGLIDPAVCGCIIGRDVLLLGGAFAHRAHLLNWKWDSWQEYFRVMPSSSTGKEKEGQAPVAPMVKPIFLSKLNTVFQIGLVVSAISHGAMAWPDQQWVVGLGYITAATTVASGAIYVRMYFKGQMLA